MGTNEKPTYHLTPNKRRGGWDIRKEGSSKAVRHYTYKIEALGRARRLSKSKHANLVIHKSDGQIQRGYSYR